MKARVHVFFKDSVFDPQGNTIAESLKRIGFQRVEDVRVGRVIDVTLKDASVSEAQHQIQEMCEKLLANPVIESYSVEIEGAK